MDFKELATKRFSVRRYTNEPVSKADIEYIMECVKLAPSAHNFQPWKFLLITSEEAKAKIRQCYNRPWFAQAPMYVLAMKNTNGCWVRPEDNKPHGDIDLGIAVEHLCLAAADRGLGTCWVCNYDVAAVKRLFPVEGFEALVIIPIGHISPDCPHPEKVRKDIHEIVEEI
jgi:nitroreductase